MPPFVVAMGSGLVMWWFDLGGTEIHKWSAVAFGIAVVLHLWMHWRMYFVHGRGLLRRLFRCPKKVPQPAPIPVLVVVPAPPAPPAPEPGWVIEVAPGWTQSELDEFVKLRTFFSDNGGVLDSLTLAHVRGSRASAPS